jgi:uncharacterized protein
MIELSEKYDKLVDYLRELESVAVAFSGGVDSTFLLKTAHNVLGDNAIAITYSSCLLPKRELDEAVEFCEANGIAHYVFEVDEMQIEGFTQNPVNRCYICKRELFGKIIDLAHEHNIDYVVEGSNVDDMGDYRPGMKAIEELGVLSPLRYAELTKNDIRKISKELGLSTATKPSFACLATRFVYGDTITKEKLAMVEKAERLLYDIGFKQFRVRVHTDIARIEVLPEQFNMLLDNREKIVTAFKLYGFSYVAMDLQGYRTGSMNETIDLETV